MHHLFVCLFSDKFNNVLEMKKIILKLTNLLKKTDDSIFLKVE